MERETAGPAARSHNLLSFPSHSSALLRRHPLRVRDAHSGNGDEAIPRTLRADDSLHHGRHDVGLLAEFFSVDEQRRPAEPDAAVAEDVVQHRRPPRPLRLHPRAPLRRRDETQHARLHADHQASDLPGRARGPGLDVFDGLRHQVPVPVRLELDVLLDHRRHPRGDGPRGRAHVDEELGRSERPVDADELRIVAERRHRRHFVHRVLRHVAQAPRPVRVGGSPLQNRHAHGLFLAVPRLPRRRSCGVLDVPGLEKARQGRRAGAVVHYVNRRVPVVLPGGQLQDWPSVRHLGDGRGGSGLGVPRLAHRHLQGSDGERLVDSGAHFEHLDLRPRRRPDVARQAEPQRQLARSVLGLRFVRGGDADPRRHHRRLRSHHQLPRPLQSRPQRGLVHDPRRPPRRRLPQSGDLRQAETEQYDQDVARRRRPRRRTDSLFSGRRRVLHALN
mmetsp:Transcript_16603/g.50280  ORF Transcript_16603/g.50280 Transcript_16603/m.50280 type:complete len:446 (+) Transcript_16603:1180-2517(+)